MAELRICCPQCALEFVRFRIQYECNNGHKWGEEVDMPPAEEGTPRVRHEYPQSGMVMPFGKHKGQLISSLETSYISWCLENLHDLRDDLRTEFQNQLEMRSGRGVVRTEVRREGHKFHFGKKE